MRARLRQHHTKRGCVPKEGSEGEGASTGFSAATCQRVGRLLHNGITKRLSQRGTLKSREVSVDQAVCAKFVGYQAAQ